eukprot:13024164-Alexandrium_andersonii.AAC.1
MCRIARVLPLGRPEVRTALSGAWRGQDRATRREGSCGLPFPPLFGTVESIPSQGVGVAVLVWQ